MDNHNSVRLGFLKKISYLLNIVLLFSIVFDPYNMIFHVKNLAFVLFVLTSLPFIDFKYFYVPLVFLTVFFFSLSFGLMTNQNLDWNKTLAMLKSFLFLSYILWMPCNYLKTFKVFYYICLLLAVLQIILFVLLLAFPELLSAFVLMVNNEQDSTIAGIGMRSYYGIFMPMVFYKTSPLLVIPLGFQTARFFENKSFSNFIQFAIIAFGFFVSGTRADMLSCIVLILASFIFYSFYIKKRILLSAIMLAFLTVAFLITVVFLLTTHEYSTDIKAGHMQSFMKLFDENILKFLLVGTGPVSYMYTSARNEITTLTELTYLEMIKNFGLVQTILLVCILILPIFYIYKNQSFTRLQKFSLSLSYIAYLFICGTNPLLISSTGFTAVAVMFSLGNENSFFDFKTKKRKPLHLWKDFKTYFLRPEIAREGKI